MNVLIVSGNLGRDAEVRQVGGSSVANFSVAAKSGYGDKQQTIWIDCALWGSRAESRLVDYLKKGQQVVVSGEMGTREHDGKTYITLRVQDITLAGGKSEGAHEPQRAQGRSAPASAPSDDYEDDIPFN